MAKLSRVRKQLYYEVSVIVVIGDKGYRECEDVERQVVEGITLLAYLKAMCLVNFSPNV